MSTPLPKGTRLKGDEYEIIQPLGQGGFGITYEARQINLDRIVAIKEFFMKDCCERDGDTSSVSVPTQSNRDLVDKFRNKFVREARMIASFDNPYVVRVIDIFNENGTAYYVMENLPGGSLTDKVRREGPLPEAVAEKYIRQVAGALDYIHSQNTVHLDVKPSNVLLNSKGDAVLIDFGISKHYDEAGQQTSSTPVGISKGYAPLEQYQQTEIRTFTPATDIYSLGATLYFLVTGQVPPGASEVNEDGLPPMPGTISVSVRHAIEKAMQPRRKDRPQSVAEFLCLVEDTSGTVKKEEAEKKDNDETREETVLAGVGPKAIDGNPPRISAPKPAPAVNDSPKPKPSVTKESVPTANSPKPSRRGLWIAVASGVAALGLILFFLLRGDGTNESTFQATGTSNGHGWVDLGLSVKWATCNIGASSPEDYGDYFAWGETSTKNNYTWENYRYRVSGDSYENVSFSKYNNLSERGKVDYKFQLEVSDDAARANWGGAWRTPTDEEWEEMRTRCKWTWTRLGGKKGYKVTGPNGNSIFLPAAGFRNGTYLTVAGSSGYYWSSSLGTGYPGGARDVYFDSGEVYGYDDGRCYGQSVRPVSE